MSPPPGVPPAPRSARSAALASHAVGAALLGLAMLGALAIGPVRIDPIAAWHAPADDPSHVILVGARAPRVALAALVGGALGLAGAALQALLSNPLACPHVLGISGGAALAGILATLAVPTTATAGSWLGGAGLLALAPGAAFAGALATAALVHAVAAGTGRATGYALLLSGVVFNAFAGALIAFVTTFADSHRTGGVLSWVVGAITVRGGAWTLTALVTLAAGLVLLSATARDLNALGLGEEGAASLGVDVTASRRRVYVAVAVLVAGAVPVSGMIGFVGMLVPHFVRLFLGADQRRVLPASMWGGAVFLVLADTAARSVSGATELPVGVITALCGGPFFLFLLRRRGARELGAV